MNSDGILAPGKSLSEFTLQCAFRATLLLNKRPSLTTCPVNAASRRINAKRRGRRFYYGPWRAELRGTCAELRYND